MSFQFPCARRALLPAFATVLIALTFAAPASVARSADLRSVDWRDAGARIQAPRQDLRSPDTRDAANRYESPTSSPATTSPDRGSRDAVAAALAQERYYGSYGSDTNPAAARIAARQDLRSPDTRDIADGREYPPIPTVVTLKEIKAPEPVPATGFDWLAAVTGAATTLGAILLMITSAVIVTRRRAHRDQPVAAT
jgi:hypothetical protein